MILILQSILIDCESTNSACDGLSKHAHFHNFGMAFLTLFRIATGDNWNGIMKVNILNEIRKLLEYIIISLLINNKGHVARESAVSRR